MHLSITTQYQRTLMVKRAGEVWRFNSHVSYRI